MYSIRDMHGFSQYEISRSLQPAADPCQQPYESTLFLLNYLKVHFNIIVPLIRISQQVSAVEGFGLTLCRYLSSKFFAPPTCLDSIFLVIFRGDCKFIVFIYLRYVP